MSQALRGGLARLELTTKVTLAVLALASGVYTYLGVRGLLNGSNTMVFLGAVIYASAVSVGIYAFWTFLMRFMPHVESRSSRGLLYVAMGIGSAMIIAMSSWLNAAALAGGAALEQHLSNTTETYQQKLEKAHANALAAQSLLPDIELASQRFKTLSTTERRTGALTGTSGSGTVVQLLSQMASQLKDLGRKVEASRDRIDGLYQQAGRHLARMRQLVSSPGPIEARSNAYAEEAVALAGVIATVQQASVAPAVKRTADDLGRTFIAPAPDGRSAELAQRQTDVVTRVETSVKQQARALANAADEILRRAPVKALRFTPLSTPEAVLRYASDFLPSWAGAISIDLLPAVLIFILCVVHGAIRRGDGIHAVEEDTMTAGEIIRALNLHRAMNGQEPITSQQAFPGLAAAAAMDQPTELTQAHVQQPPQQQTRQQQPQQARSERQPHDVYDQPVTPAPASGNTAANTSGNGNAAGDAYAAQLSPERIAAGDTDAHKTANIRKLEAQIEGASVTPISSQKNG